MVKFNSQIVESEFNSYVYHNIEKNITYIATPKSASQTMRDLVKWDVLMINNFKDGTLFKNNDKYDVGDCDVIAIFREPVSRYVSGFIEIMYPSSDFIQCRYKSNENLSGEVSGFLDEIQNKDDITKFKMFTNYIIDNGFFERHSVPQSYYLLDQNKISKIYKLEQINDCIKHYRLGNPTHSNKTESPSIKSDIIKFIKNDNEYREKIESLFMDDVKIYNSL